MRWSPLFSTMMVAILTVQPAGFSDQRHSSRIPPEAVVNRTGWNLQTADALQSLADARGTPVYYAVITDLNISGDVATVVFGSDIRVPSRERNVVIVCCELATDEYERTSRGWKFVKRISVVAS